MFSPDGTMIAVNDEVYATKTGARMYRPSDPDSRIKGWTRESKLLVFYWDHPLELVDPRTGKVEWALTEIDRIIDIQTDGAAALLMRKSREVVLLDTATGKTLPLPEHPFGAEATGFAGERGVIVFGGVGDADGYGVTEMRLSDKSLLHHLGGLFAMEDGVYSGPEETWVEGAFRMGGDVMGNRVVKLSDVQGAWYRKDLRRAFLAGEKITRPALPQ